VELQVEKMRTFLDGMGGISLEERVMYVEDPGFMQYSIPGNVWLADTPPENDPDPDACPRIEYRIGGSGFVWADAKKSALAKFIRLDKGPEAGFPQRVLAFAQKWGPLGICRHRLMSGHFDACRPLDYGIKHLSHCWEPIEAWQRYVQHLSGLLCVMGTLFDQVPGSHEDWASVEAAVPGPEKLRTHSKFGDEVEFNASFEMEDYYYQSCRKHAQWQDNLDQQRSLVTYILKKWIKYGNLFIQPFWMGNTQRVSVFPTNIGSSGLSSVLACDLLAAFTSPSGIRKCAGCNKPFIPSGERRRAKNKKAWCPTCGNQAKWRDYQRRRYQQRKQLSPI
jgi:hypothetical protein